MRILSIETSCDETAIALLDCKGRANDPSFKILKSTVASQIKIHAPFGGVVPNLAKREHLKNLPILYRRVVGEGNTEKRELGKIDVIAVTVGPGLEPALWTGIEFAKEIHKKTKAYGYKTVLLGANHMQGHLYSSLLGETKRRPQFPGIALVVSGGHTILLKMDSMTKWKNLGETRDDAAGEAFDKVARLLDLPYPGGPEISKIAKKGDPDSIQFPQPMLHSKNYDFSFSGLKTAVLYHLKGLGYGIPDMAIKDHNAPKIAKDLVADIAASFEKTAVGVLSHKTFRAVEEFEARSVWLSGGVAANALLRKELLKGSKKYGIPLFVANKRYNTDNAAMIAAAAYMSTFRNKKYPLTARGDLGI